MLKNMKNNEKPKNRQCTTANERLQAAIAARDRFLEQHPHLNAQQAEIDRLLDKSGDHQGRMAVLGTLIQGKLLEMQNELVKLTGILQDTLTTGNRSFEK